MVRPSIAALLLVLAMAGPASAVTYQRTFVASTGLDTNTCRLTDPCRSFNAAIAQTSPGGEVVILDTAGYGPMTINKAIKIIGPSGVYGGISVQGGPSNPTTGIVINAGSGDDITLRGLDITGVPGAAPLPLLGIDIQSAGAVHIEKSSVGNFTQDTSACINVSVATTVRVFVEDSFLRECRNGIYANGSAVIGNRPSIAVDNTRIERGRGPVIAVGLWIQGFMDVTVRNTAISREDVAIQFDGGLAGGSSRLVVANSQLSRMTTGVQYSNATDNANAQITLVGSQIVDATDGLTVSNSGVATTYVKLMDTYVGQLQNNGMTFANSGATNVSKMGLELVNSMVALVGATAIGVSATNGSHMWLDLRDSTTSGAVTHIKTSGSASDLQVTLTRSNFHHGTTGIDHGFGSVQLDGTHWNTLGADFINNGSGDIVSNGQNMIHNVTDAPGPVYIVPTKISLF